MVKFEFDFQTSRKKKTYGIGRVPAEAPFQAICVGVHGFGEHAQRYEHLAEFLVKKNIGFIGFDLLGHGKSEGKRGHIVNIQDFIEQVFLALALVQEKFPDVPLFIYGHSMGGNLVTNFLQYQKPAYLKGAIITSPWFRLAFEPPKWKIILGQIMASIHPEYTDKSTLEPEKLSTDPQIGKKYENDTLVHSKITAGLFQEITKGGEKAIENASVFQLPTLMMHGTDDQITSIEASREYVQNAENEQLQFIEWDGLRHELHNEIKKMEVLKTITDFIEAQIKG